MKKVFLIIAACLTLTANLYSQCPNPSIADLGFHPPENQLPPIQKGMPYDETVQLNLPGTFDTSFLGFPVTVTVNDVTINNITGQPTGINYTCAPANCVFSGGSAGCINFNGTTNDAAGQYPLAMTVTINVNVPAIPLIYPGGQQSFGPFDLSTIGFSYSLNVDDGALSVVSIGYNFAFDVYPNPSSGVVSLEFSTENSGDVYDLTVMDLVGKKVFEENFSGINGTVQRQLDLSNLPKGTYALQLSSKEEMGIKKLVIR